MTRTDWGKRRGIWKYSIGRPPRSQVPPAESNRDAVMPNPFQPEIKNATSSSAREHYIPIQGYGSRTWE